MSAATQNPAQTGGNPPRKVTEVAVGVLVQPDGRFLLAQRPAGKPYEGYWEFPGGKLEPGESVEAALAREKAAVATTLGYPPGALDTMVNDYLRTTRHARAVVDKVFWG